MKTVKLMVFGILLTCLSIEPVFSQADDSAQPDQSSVTDRQLAVMMFVDYGRSYGYQAMMAQIQVDTIKAELERDRQIVKQNEELFRKNAVSRTELEIPNSRLPGARNS